MPFSPGKACTIYRKRETVRLIPLIGSGLPVPDTRKTALTPLVAYSTWSDISETKGEHSHIPSAHRIVQIHQRGIS